MATTKRSIMRNLKAGDRFAIDGVEHIAICDATFIGDSIDGEFYIESQEDCYFEHEFA